MTTPSMSHFSCGLSHDGGGRGRYRYRPFFVWLPSRCEWKITTRAPPEAATAARELKNLEFMVLVRGLQEDTAAQAIWSGIQRCHEGLLCVLPELEIRQQSG